MKRILTTLALILGLCPNAALADFNATAGAGLVVFGFTCFSTKVCTAWVPINSAGTELFTGANPGIAAGSGTAGTAATGVLTVQGIAAMTPIIVTNSGTFAVQAAQSGTWTVQPGNTANTTPWLVAGSGASGAALAGNPFRVGLSDGTNNQNWLAAIALADGVNGNNTGAVAGWLWNGATYDRWRGDLTNGAFVNVKTSVLPTGGATSANQTSELTKLDSIITNTAAAVPAGTARIGYVSDDPCTQLTKTNVAISQTAGTQIIAGTSAKKTYICSMALISGAAEIVNIIAGTGSVCATGTSVVMGSSTAANGLSLAANGGLTLGNGGGSVAIASAVNADNVCLTQSTSSRVAGVITYVQQ